MHVSREEWEMKSNKKWVGDWVHAILQEVDLMGTGGSVEIGASMEMDM